MMDTICKEFKNDPVALEELLNFLSRIDSSKQDLELALLNLIQNVPCIKATLEDNAILAPDFFYENKLYILKDFAYKKSMTFLYNLHVIFINNLP